MTGEVRLIARREIVTRLQQKGYRISVLVALVIVVAACVLPALFSGGDDATSYKIGIAPGSPGLGTSLTTVGRTQGDRVTVEHVSPGAARAEVRSGRLDAAVLPGHLVVQHSDDAVVQLIQVGYQLERIVGRLHTAGLSERQALRALDVSPLGVTTTASRNSAQNEGIAIITVVALFTQLILFCTWVAMGVVEEKSSRVVELVLSSVRPRQLLAGKLLGIGAVAAAQVLLLGSVAVVAAIAAGTISIPASAILTVVVSFVAFLLGFAFFASLAAALGSTVSRQEEVSGILAPVSMMLTVSYGVSFAVAHNPDSTFARIMSILPPVSSLAMPARIARGGVPVVDVVLAVVLLVAAAVGILVVAARVYRASVLHSGTRVSLRRAWRGEAVG